MLSSEEQEQLVITSGIKSHQCFSLKRQITPSRKNPADNLPGPYKRTLNAMQDYA